MGRTAFNNLALLRHHRLECAATCRTALSDAANAYDINKKAAGYTGGLLRRRL